jgi:uncharacterized repeat protein (TIGR03803 family)
LRRSPFVVGSALVACIALAGCSRATGPALPGLASAGFAQEGNVGSFSVVHSFGGAKDGNTPFGSLNYDGDNFLGTTSLGGVAAMGTVFKTSSKGAERVLHSFAGGSSDGAASEASLIESNGTLYGTTYSGGPNDAGVVFRVTSAGTEKVLHAFGSGQDGRYPRAGLIYVNNMLYGTTYAGGTCATYGGCGTIFAINPKTGTEHILHSFGNGTDGSFPYYSGLTLFKSTLFGTTTLGGKYGYGAVFSESLAGAERVLYSFKGGSDGANPYAGLIIVKGTLYGTTVYGGKIGHGAVFSLSTAGAEHVLYSFSSNNLQYDAAQPSTSLIYVNGTFYGTAGYGGADGDGAIYSVSLQGNESVLYSFSGVYQAFPSSLLYVNGALFGTTQFDGTNNNGTVFRLAVR